MAHPPRSKPPLRSSSGPPIPCITPSTETLVVVVNRMSWSPPYVYAWCAHEARIASRSGASVGNGREALGRDANHERWAIHVLDALARPREETIRIKSLVEQPPRSRPGARPGGWLAPG